MQNWQKIIKPKFLFREISLFIQNFIYPIKSPLAPTWVGYVPKYLPHGSGEGHPCVVDAFYLHPTKKQYRKFITVEPVHADVQKSQDCDHAAHCTRKLPFFRTSLSPGTLRQGAATSGTSGPRAPIIRMLRTIFLVIA